MILAVARQARWAAFRSTPVGGLRLDAYRVHAARMTTNRREWWTECEMDFSEPLGRERALRQWVTRDCHASKETAARFVRLVGALADATGGVRYINEFDRVPALLHKEWREFGGRIAQVAGASWCAWCGHDPASSPERLCVWCHRVAA